MPGKWTRTCRSCDQSSTREPHGSLFAMDVKHARSRQNVKGTTRLSSTSIYRSHQSSREPIISYRNANQQQANALLFTLTHLTSKKLHCFPPPLWTTLAAPLSRPNCSRS